MCHREGEVIDGVPVQASVCCRSKWQCLYAAIFWVPLVLQNAGAGLWCKVISASAARVLLFPGLFFPNFVA